VDISAGLTLIGQAIGIVKDLREIDKGFDVAAIKAQMADLYSTLADVKIALSDARETIHERDRRIKDLEDKITSLTSGEMCPICKAGRMGSCLTSTPTVRIRWSAGTHCKMHSVQSY
jgi:hypothetical protein